ncbi:NAD(P)/FAD-dependent oxidoreductase [Nocardia yunnanensis]|uniref:NAD(P)/FAD-dependent oxidoreductase n=1 Tax=Nocardia yunnanensis TaxID=2382165 RepID=UPI001FE6B91A|nr:FAD-dependent oxidoreductase [Nocardia yunnanensis]
MNPRAEFVERVRLHEQLAGTGRAATPLTDMLRAGIDTRIGSVDKVGDGVVALHDSTELPFDYALLAVGSTVVAPADAIPVGIWEGAERARALLGELSADAAVTVVGGGLTGIETASEIAESHPELRVRLVSPAVGASLSPRVQRRVLGVLERLGVQLVHDTVTGVRAGDDARSGTITLSGGEVLDSALTLWAIVSGVPDLAARSGLRVNSDGRAVVDQYLRSVSDPRIFVIGDCAAVPGARFACATAGPQGAHAAATLARLIGGRTPKPFSMGYTGQALSLGRRDGLVQAARRDDTLRRLHISGRLAAVSKELVNRYAKFGARTAIYAWVPGPVRLPR